MAKKRYVLLALITAFLCLIASPTLAKAPELQLHSQPGIVSASRSSQAESLVEQGKILYDAGKFTEAILVLQQAAIAFKEAGDGLREAMTLSNLSLAFEQLGSWGEAQRAITQSLQLLQTGQNLDTSSERAQIMAQALDVQGRLQLAQGKTEAALNTWQRAANIYKQLSDNTKLVRNRINSAQALQALGLYRQASKILIEVKQTLVQPDSLLVATGLRSLGNVLRVVGDLDSSRETLEQSLAVAKRIQSPTAVGDTLLSLGNTERAKQDFQAARQYYQQAANLPVSELTRVQVHINLLSLLIKELENKEDFDKLKDALALSSQIQSEISNLSPSRTSVYARINFAQNLTQLKLKTSTDTPSWLDIAQQLSTAEKQAQSLQDLRAQSYARGTLGALYEQTGQLSEAFDLTENALYLTQKINALDIAYQWQWQLGRLLKKRGDIEGAIKFYNVAYETLQSLRSDLVAINPDIQFSFTENVEPVYRELVELLLQSHSKNASSEDNLTQARSVIESLQLAELDNFFRSACLTAKQELDPIVDKKDQQAAVIYPIISPSRLDVILKLPNQRLRPYSTPIPQDEVKSVLVDLRESLLDVTKTFEVKQKSQQVYDWLIRPIEDLLIKNNIKTLVFVLDGELRNVPMAVLYDKQQQKYLVEKYAIALAPSLQLLDPKPLQQVQLNALTAGLNQKRFGFGALQNVPRELKQIQAQIPRSKELLNQSFTESNLQNQLRSVPFSVVHLATHGEFSSDPDKTFIVTWDKKVKVKDFDNLLRVTGFNKSNSIELLVLSACKTAEGDKRAALGLAGIAVRAGARSTLATLWSVDDQSTADLMSKFYRELKTRVNKAEALQRAQLAVKATQQEPYFWAPYVLVGNWL